MAEPHASPLFSQGASPTARLMLYCLAAVLLMAMDQRGQYVDRVRSAASLLVAPVYQLVEWPFAAADRLRSDLRLREELETELMMLRQLLAAQQVEQQRLDGLDRENRRLRALLDASAGESFDYLYAQLMHLELDENAHRILINRGADAGIHAGQVVVDGEGVVGQVEQVLPGSTRVRLLSDPAHALPVQVARTGLRTILYGTGLTDALLMPDVPLNADIRQGDRIRTSGLGGRFPTGLPVATVMSVQRIPGETFATVYARPLAALERGREVLLIAPEADSDPVETAAGADSPATGPEEGS